MKKLLLIAASTALLSSNVYAREDVFSVEASVGGTMLQRDKTTLTGKFSGQTISQNFKLKSKNVAPVLSFGIGYGVMDTFRGVLEYSHYFKPEHKGNAAQKFSDTNISGSVKQKLNVDSLMLKGIVDLFDAGPAKFFAGAGVGMAKVKQHVHLKAAGKDAAGNAVSIPNADEVLTMNPSSSFKSKNKNNFAYTVLVGAGYEVSTGVNLDLTYSFSDFGKTKPLTYKGNNVSTKTKVQAHDIKLGLRFEI